MLHLSERDMAAVENLLEGEYLAAKKARLCSTNLLDAELAEGFTRLALEHEKRFETLYRLLGGEA